MTDDYKQNGSLDGDAPSAVGVGTETIAVAINEDVTVVSAHDQTTIDHGTSVVDLAITDRLLVLSLNKLTAYTFDGNRVWSQDVADAYAVAGTESRDYCAILDTETLRFIETTSGRERLTVDRSRPGTPDDDLIPTSTGFVIATWSFLTAVDADGEVVFDRDLSAVILSVGICDDTVIAALQSDHLVGLDLETGQNRWRTDLDVQQIAPIGEKSVFVSGAAGVLSVEAAGATETIPDIPADEVYATRNGETVCAVRDGTTERYVSDGDQFGVELLTDSVGVGGTVDLQLSNQTESARTAEIRLDVDGCSLTSADRTVMVGEDTDTVAEFPVDSVHREGNADVSVVIDDNDDDECGTIVVKDEPDGEIAVKTELKAMTIDTGIAEVTVTVENVGDVPLETVQLLEADVGVTEIAPGETWEGTTTRPYEPERRVSVGLEVKCGDRRREYAPTCTLPAIPTIDTTVKRDALRATVTVADNLSVSDQIVIEMPGAGRVRSPVTISDDELLLLIPQYESGVARIAFDALDAEERVQVSGTGTLSTLSSTDGLDDSQPLSTGETTNTPRQTPSTESTEATEDTDASSATDSTAGENSAHSRTLEGRQENNSKPDQNHRSHSSAGRIASTSRTDQPGTSENPPTEVSNRDQMTERSPNHSLDDLSLSATRRTPERVPGIGHTVRDRIVVENRGDPVESVDVVLAEQDRVTLDPLARDETTAVERFVAASEGSELTLQPATVETTGVTVDEVGTETLQISDDQIDILATVDPAENTLTAEFDNKTNQHCRVTGVDPGPDGNRASLSTTVDPHKSATLSAGLPDHTAAESTALVSFWLEMDGDDEQCVDVLAVPHSSTVEYEMGSEQTPSAWITPETQVAGEYSSVVLAVENDTDDSLENVAVVADNGPVDSMFYSPARRDQIKPGDRIEHYVDLESGQMEPGFEVTVSYSVDEIEREYIAHVSGPAVNDESEWTDEHLAAWSLEWIDKTAVSPELPSPISTPLRTEE